MSQEAYVLQVLQAYLYALIQNKFSMKVISTHSSYKPTLTVTHFAADIFSNNYVCPNVLFIRLCITIYYYFSNVYTILNADVVKGILYLTICTRMMNNKTTNPRNNLGFVANSKTLFQVVFWKLQLKNQNLEEEESF